MQAAAREQYLAAEVMTAPPQKLQLLLIEGAMRFCNLALGKWEQGENEAGGEALTRAQGVVTELIAGVRPEHHRELARKAASPSTMTSNAARRPSGLPLNMSNEIPA